MKAKGFLSGYNDSATASAGFTINSAGSSSLSGQMSQSPSAVNLSTEGTTDWAHWGLTTASSFNHKSGVTQQISNYTLIGSTAAGRFNDSRVAYTWSGGTPTASASSSTTGLYFTGIGDGYQLSVPAATTDRTVKLYLSVYQARGRLEARLSDGSVSSYVDYVDNSTGSTDRVVTITYHAAGTGVNLIVSFTVEDNYGSTWGNVTLQAATLVAGAATPTVATPTITPNGGTFSNSVSVTLATTTSGASIRYTIDGTDPTASSTLYSAPITLTQSVTLKAKGFLSGYNDSTTASAAFTITATPTVATPTITPAGGTYTGSVSVTLATTTAGASIRYTTNGTDPTASSTLYSAPITLTQSVTLKAKGFLSGYNDSTTASAGFTITVTPTVATPTITPNGGTYTNSVSVTLATQTAGASIRYTTNGTDPTASSTLYSAPITVTQSLTLKAKGFLSGYNNSATASAGFTINPAGSSSLSGQMSQSPSAVNLSTEGTTDWAHWGLSTASSFDHKSGVTQQISNYTLIGSTAPGRFADSRVAYTWSGGTPTASASSSTTGLYFTGIGNGYQLSVPAATTDRTVKLYLSAYQARGRLEARLSDGSVSSYVDYVDNSTGSTDRVVTITYHAAGTGVNLIVAFTVEDNYGSTWGNVTLQAATLKPADIPLSLPFSDDFNRTNLGAWAVFDDSPDASSWQIQNAQLYELNRVESVDSFDGTYHTGTYVYLTTGLGLTDYRFSVQATYLSTFLADDIGIMFRYRDNDNYYRLSMNSRYGFTRLEKKVNGSFSTLAMNARGYMNGATLNITIDVKGSTIEVYLDGDPLFGISDSSIGSGSVALYCQDVAKFDNVVLENPSSQPSVIVSRPLSYSVVPGNTLDVAAVAENVPSGGYVEFLLDGTSSSLALQPPYGTQYFNVTQGEHTVAAVLHDPSSELARDTNNKVRVADDYFIAIGDSITNGEGDYYTSDNILPDGTIISFQGYEAPLTYSLNLNVFSSGMVYNEGIGGDRSYNAAYQRVNSILERHPEATRALIMLGTNDSSGSLPVPSGLGCSGSSCTGTYEENMQTLINILRSRQISPIVAHIPPTFDSSNPSRNTTVQEYNQVIDQDLTGIQPGPDFYHFFQNHSDLFYDTLHPNGLGHKCMAQLWYNFLLNQNQTPFILQNLAPGTYKQNILEAGNTYYGDMAYTLQSIPAEITGGDVVWIVTNYADRNSTSANAVSFDIADDSTIYVGYDSRALALPNWLRSFTLVSGSTIGTTDPAVGILNLYKLQANVADGTVILGGNKATGASFPAGVQASNYVVIVKKNAN